MNKPENEFWKKIKRTEFNISDIELERVENSASTGMPDVYVRSVSERLDAWIELKTANVIKGKIRCYHPVSGVQKVWLERQWRCSMNAFTLVQIKDDKIIEYLMVSGLTSGSIEGHDIKTVLPMSRYLNSLRDITVRLDGRKY